MKYVIRKVPERDTSYLEKHIPNALVYSDVKHEGCRKSFVEAILLANDDACYVQDDMILCKQFVERTQEYISKHPNNVIVFSNFTNLKGNQIYQEGFWEPRQAGWLLCTYIPKRIAMRFVEAKRQGSFQVPANAIKYDFDDMEFNRFLEKEGEKVFLAVPNLAGHPKNQSVTGFKRPPRTCPNFDYEKAEKKINEVYEYGKFYEKYDMQGEIHIGTGIVQVHDIFNPLPAFMRQADVIFSDPPYNKTALNGYYTKAGLEEKPESFEAFFYRFIECVDIISPRLLCLEVGLAQTDMYIREFSKIYSRMHKVEAWYYGNKNQKCNILFFSNEAFDDCILAMPSMDEEKVIDYLCKNIVYSCIGDLCMGKGLVGYYSNKYGKKFVGTELNPKRLAVCCERVTKNERGKIN